MLSGETTSLSSLKSDNQHSQKNLDCCCIPLSTPPPLTDTPTHPSTHTHTHTHTHTIMKTILCYAELDFNFFTGSLTSLKKQKQY